MPRIRSIKPEFFTSHVINELTPSERLTFIGLLTQCDDEGRTKADSRLIKAGIWPLFDEITLTDIKQHLLALANLELITLYSHKKLMYLEITGWYEHQRIDRPTTSKLPWASHPDSICYENSKPKIRKMTIPLLNKYKGKLPDYALSVSDVSEISPDASANPPGAVNDHSESTPRSIGEDSTSTPRSIGEDSTRARAGKERKGREGKGGERKKNYSTFFEKFWRLYPSSAPKCGKPEAYLAYGKTKIPPAVANTALAKSEYLLDILRRQICEHEQCEKLLVWVQNFPSAKRWLTGEYWTAKIRTEAQIMEAAQKGKTPISKNKTGANNIIASARALYEQDDTVNR